MNKHPGSNFDDFLAEDGLLIETEAVALKRLLNDSRKQIARGESLTAEEVFFESNQIEPSSLHLSPDLSLERGPVRIIRLTTAQTPP